MRNSIFDEGINDAPTTAHLDQQTQHRSGGGKRWYRIHEPFSVVVRVRFIRISGKVRVKVGVRVSRGRAGARVRVRLRA